MDGSPGAAEGPEDEELLALLLADEDVHLPTGPAPAEPAPAGPDRREAPLSFGQGGVWFFEQWQPGTPTFTIGTRFDVRGPLDPEVLEQAFQAVAGRHGVLRTGYRDRDGEAVQVVRPTARVPFRHRDLTGIDPSRRDAAARTLAEEEVRRPLALRDGQPIRVLLIRLAAERHLLVLSVHHIACDGRSLTDVLLPDLSAAYAAIEAGLVWQPAPAPQFADFAAGERLRWEAGELAAGLAHWTRRLAGAPRLLALPTSRPRPPRQTFRGRTVEVPVPPAVVSGVHAAAAAHGVTPFTVLLAAFSLLVARYTGQEDVVLGTSVAVRGRPELERTLGMLVNTVPLRADLSGDPRFTELVARVHATAADAYAHQEVPFDRVVNALGLDRVLSHHPVFQVVFGMLEDTAGARALGAAELSGMTYVERNAAKYDMTWNVVAGAETRIELEYNTDLFDEPAVRAMAGHYLRVLESVLADPAVRVGGVRLVDPPLPVPAPAAPRPVRDCVHELVARHAADSPQATAVTDGERSLSYAELDRRANQVAHHLRAAGVREGDLVAVCAERGADLVVSLLGVLKAGAAYLPLDPEYPAPRLRFLLEDSGATLVVTHGTAGRVPDGPWTVTDLTAQAGAVSARPQGPPEVAVCPDDLAYVIYTSGSTGRPKGVEVPHRNVVRLLSATQPWFHFGRPDVWTFFHSFAFDFSVWELWGALTTGGRLVVVPYLVSRSPAEFHALLADERVTVLNQTPSAFRALEAVQAGLPPALRLVVFGGEPVDLPSVGRWFGRHGSTRPALVNMYGITETTVHVTHRRLTPGDVAAGGSPVGEPIPDLQVHVLDRWGNPVPPGVPGELFVGGAGVARGYRNRPAPTAERFVPDPFSGIPGARLYRTGDIGRRAADGTLEHLGRNDDQVKVRGFRIEVGEVEAVLRRHPVVRAAAVLARRDGDGPAQLVGYAAVREPVAADRLRDHLAAELPGHLVPSRFVLLDELPVTAHGKVDRDALPAPDAARPELSHEYVAPATEAERALAGVWAEVLGLERVGARDSFFDVGGDSIRSLQVIGLARRRGWEVALQDLFGNPVLADLAARARPARDTAAPATEPFALVDPGERSRLPEGLEDAYPLSVLQAGMVYHMELDPENLPYHNLNSFHLRARFDAGLFRQAMQDVVDRHPVLRTSFDLGGFREPLQLVHRTAQIPTVVEDLRALPEQEQEQALLELFRQERQRPFDLSRPPFLRLFLHRRTDESFQWTLTEHHAIVDGWSLFTFHAEVFQRYLRLLDDPSAPREPSPRSLFRDFVAMERATATSAEERRYWTEKFADCTPVTLPGRADGATPAAGEVHDTSITGELADGVRRWRFTSTRDASHRSLESLLPEQLVEDLLALAARVGVPFKTVLLAAHLKVIGVATGRHDVVTGVTANGRPEDVDSTDVCGMYLNMPPLRVDVAGGTWTDLVRRVYEAEQEMLPHRRYPLANIQWDLGDVQLFDNTFVYNHFHVMADVLGSGLSVLGNRVESTGDYRAEPTNYTLSTGFLRDPRSSRVLLRLDYYTARLTDAQAEAISGYYLAVLSAMAGPDGAHEEFSPHDPLELRRMLTEWNGPARDYPVDRCVHELVEEQARRTPDAVAVTDGRTEIGYAELNRRANRLARHLQLLGAGPERVVAVCAHRDVELPVILLAVLKSGAAYLPLDPQYPADRLRFTLEDAGAFLVVCSDTALGRRLPAGPWTVLGTDEEAAAIAALPAEDLGRTSHPDNLMYIIYTSGSTGRPKGVQVPHSGVVNYLGWCVEGYASRGSGGAPVFSSIAFDMIVPNLYTPLITGERLCMVHDALGTVELAQHLDKLAPFTFVKLTPGHLDLLNQLLGPARARELAPTLAVGADAFPTRILDAWRRHDQDSVILNEYGPTEASVGNTVFFVDGPVTADLVPIGRAIPNTTMYVLDHALNPVPAGATGELYIGGACVVRGYQGRPGLTAERFLPDPFAGSPGARMYRTGDLGRWLPDGQLEFLGRNDDQVKIAGHRIEPGEMEAVLAEHPAVEQAVAAVIGTDPQQRRLVGYYVAARPVTEEELFAHLAQRLPAYLVPSVLMPIETLPLNANGKVDRKALPHPRGGGATAAGRPEPPRSPAERLIAALWQELLGVTGVGRADNFLALGGNSLLATQLTFRLRDLGVPVGLPELLRARTLAELAGTVDRGTGPERLDRALALLHREEGQS
jgi:amino acid adenylation domain-containing protein